MTFSDLVAAVEAKFPVGDYSIHVELCQNTAGYRACEHIPKVQRTLLYRIWDGDKFHEGRLPELALKALEDARSKKAPAFVTDETVRDVDAHNMTVT